MAINAITFLCSRGIAAHVTEWESAHLDWERKRAEWLNRRADRAEQKADKDRTATGQSEHQPDEKRIVPYNEQTMLDCYRENPLCTMDELKVELDLGRTSVYSLRNRLVREGKLHKLEGGGYHV